MDYLGYSVPFYVSRYRLRLLADRLGKSKMNWGGSIGTTGIAELHLDTQALDEATGRRLERVLDWLNREGAIGDPDKGEYQYSWVHLHGRATLVRNVSSGVNHLLVGGEAISPPGWACLLIGSMANLTSKAGSKVPSLGSSPLAIQAVLAALASRKSSLDRSSRKSGVGSVDLIRHGLEALKAEPATLDWDLAGVVEVVMRSPDDRVLLGSPLYLCYNA